MSTSTTTANAPIVFIMDNVADHQSMADGLYANYEVHVLSSDGDALAQMASILDGRSGIEAIHLVSHGSAGELDLGTTQLNSGNLADHSASLALIRASLSQDADFLIYGCDVAQGDKGLAFVNALAEATGADIAASDDITGPAASGSDADLEVQSGSIEAASLDQSHFQTALTTAPVFSDSFGLLTTYNDTAAIDIFSPITGTLTADDDETASNLLAFSVSGTGSSAFGQLSVETNGDFTFTPDAQAINAMVDGQTETVTFSVSVTDGEGLTSSKDLTVSLIGATDTPVVSLSAPNFTLVEDGASAGWTGGNLLSGTLTLEDPEGSLGDTTGSRFVVLGDSFQGDSGEFYAIGQAGNLYLGADGSYEYTPSAPAIDALGDGETLTDTFTFSVENVSGVVGTGSLSVQVIGTDDLPVITLTAPSASLVEAGGQLNAQSGQHAAQIGVLMGDAEGAATVDVGAMVDQGWSLSDDLGHLTFSGVYGAATLSLASRTLVYELDNNKTATQALTDGQPVSESFTIKVVDEQDQTAEATAVFSIIGADDAPTLAIQDLQELQSGAIGRYTGIFRLGDVDTDPASYGALTYGIDGGYFDDGGVSGYTGGFGTLSVDPQSGRFDYVGDSRVIANILGGDVVYDSFSVNVFNSSGLLGSVEYEVQLVGWTPPPEA